jgi:hypothetical protein
MLNEFHRYFLHEVLNINPIMKREECFSMSKKCKWLRLCVGLVLIFTFASQAIAQEPHVKVMTRNLYVGADIFRVLDALNSGGFPAVPLAVAQIMLIVQQTNFYARAEAIADEINQYKPHLIGLQEVSLIRTQTPGDFLLGTTTPNATNVAYDYLVILMNALAKRKLKYTVAGSITEADVELPMYTTAGPPFTDVRLTDRDIILVRKDTKVSNVHAQNYTYNITVPTTPIVFTRGFVAIDAAVDGFTYRFVNTHPEVGGNPGVDGGIFRIVQALQMQELLNYLSSETKPIILVGDLNSSPEDEILPGPPPPIDIVPPYMQALDAGYIDIWDLRNKPPGLTCCFNEEVDDPYATLYERIDHILLLPNDFIIDEARTVIVGDDPSDMTDTDPSLWPSDHAGVVGQIDYIAP